MYRVMGSRGQSPYLNLELGITSLDAFIMRHDVSDCFNLICTKNCTKILHQLNLINYNNNI